jgi:hypothetical protein
VKAIFVAPLTKGQLTLPELAYTVNGKVPDGTGYSLLEEPQPDMTAIKVLIDTSPTILAAMIADKAYTHIETLPEPEPEPVDAKVIDAVYEVLGKFQKADEYAAVKAETDAKYRDAAVEPGPVEVIGAGDVVTG